MRHLLHVDDLENARRSTFAISTCLQKRVRTAAMVTKHIKSDRPENRGTRAKVLTELGRTFLSYRRDVGERIWSREDLYERPKSGQYMNVAEDSPGEKH